MTLAALIDLEAQLARDVHLEPAELEARDGGLAAGAQLDRSALLGRWLDGKYQVPVVEEDGDEGSYAVGTED